MRPHKEVCSVARVLFSVHACLFKQVVHLNSAGGSGLRRRSHGYTYAKRLSHTVQQQEACMLSGLAKLRRAMCDNHPQMHQRANRPCLYLVLMTSTEVSSKPPYSLCLHPMHALGSRCALGAPGHPVNVASGDACGCQTLRIYRPQQQNVLLFTLQSKWGTQENH